MVWAVGERSKDAARKRAERNKAAAITIPFCVNPERRKKCLAEPELFLKTYFPDRFYLPFSNNHREIIAAIHQRAINGGDQAVAAPRGEGKTEITSGMIIFAILAELVRFPIIVASTGVHAHRIYADIKKQFERNELLLEDFPEVCAPIAGLEGAPQRANKQHVDGELTRIEWQQHHCYFPHVKDSPFGGVCLSYAGLDSAIRGLKIHGNRPDFVLIDDPETKESADSDLQIGIRSQIIDRDIAGLAGPGETLTRMMLCTIQNLKCLAFAFTDPNQKPSWNGKRYRWIDAWPENSEFWNDYMEQRRADMKSGDPYGQVATQMYLDNREKADAGAKVSNEYRFNPTKLANGMQIEYSALQAAYNKICDTSLEAFLAEFQNDPQKEDGPETKGLTAEVVMSRINGLEQSELPSDFERVTVFLDMGKDLCFWSKVAWFGNAIGCVVDYGVVEVHPPPKADGKSDADPAQLKAIELAQLAALRNWRNELLAESPPDLVMVDSGSFTKTVYQFIREVGGTPFIASKGWGDSPHYPNAKPDENTIVGDNWHISRLVRDGIWLYNFNASFFKGWVHDRFMTKTFDESMKLQDGSLSLFIPGNNRRRHQSFAKHIVAEELREEFIPGKGTRKRWVPLHKNNHWLDTMAGNACAASIFGIKLFRRDNAERLAKYQAEAKTKPNQQDDSRHFQNLHGQPFLLTERS